MKNRTYSPIFFGPSKNQSVDHLTKASNNNNLEIHRNSYFLAIQTVHYFPHLLRLYLN